jgi:acetyl-CoA C-acetyltransferase
MGLYSTTPPAGGFRWEDVQAEVDAATAPRELAEEHEGEVAIESYTVMHERDGSMTNAIAACLTTDGRRTWATSTDADLMKAMTSDDLVGTGGVVRGGTLTVG